MDISSVGVTSNLPPDSYDTGANMGAPSAIPEERIYHENSEAKKLKISKDDRSPSKSKDYGRDRERDDREKSKKKR